MAVIKKKKRKIKKEKEIKIASNLLAMRQLIYKQSNNTVCVLLTLLLPEIKKQKKDINFTMLTYLRENLLKNIVKEKELFETLTECFSYTGINDGDEIEINQKALEKFTEKTKEYISIERCLNILETFNDKKYNLNRILNASKTKFTLESGEKFEVIRNN